MEKLKHAHLNHDFMARTINRDLKEEAKEKLKVNKDYCFVYTNPLFHSKYRLAANIIFLLT